MYSLRAINGKEIKSGTVKRELLRDGAKIACGLKMELILVDVSGCKTVAEIYIDGGAKDFTRKVRSAEIENFTKSFNGKFHVC